MILTVRVDLDYVPWDGPDAKEFGHGEPAMTIRLLELARSKGLKLHFFASNRVLRAFPTASESILNEGHHLDWLCKHPEEFGTRFEEAVRSFSKLGISPLGFALRGTYPQLIERPTCPDSVRFVTCSGADPGIGIHHFLVETRPERDALRSGQTVRAWTDAVRGTLMDCANERGAIMVVRPQVLAHVDPKLTHVNELIEYGLSLGMKLRTLRERLDIHSSQ